MFVAGLFALLMVIGTACAQQELSVWAGGGTDVGTTLCYTVVSANSKNNAQPVLTYISYSSDKAASALTFYNITNAPAAVSGANATTNVPVIRTNGFTAGDIVVLRHKATDTYERRIVGTFYTNNSVPVTVAPTVATAAGDILYKCVTTGAGTIPIGATTNSINGPGIYAGQRGLPLLIDLDGTSAVQINAATATYVP